MSDDNRCYATALRLLNFRFNGVAELRRKLRAKKFDDATIEATLLKLHEEKWLDDERFAAAFVRSRTTRRIGSVRIRRELISMGVDRDVAGHALAESADAAREREQLVTLCETKRWALERRHGEGYTASAEGRNKLAAYLVKKGYATALVRSVVQHEDE